MDASNHLYEYHTDNLADVCSKVIDFFAGNLDMDGWEKHFFSIGNKNHFLTKTFEYRVNSTAFYLRFTSMLILIIFYLVTSVVIFTIHQAVLPGTMFLFFGLLFAYATLPLLRIYSRSKSLLLQISKGTDKFIFGDAVEQGEYLKSKISEINIYGRVSGKAKQVLTIMQMHFNDGRTIKFPGLLIDPMELLTKLPDKTLINYLEQNSLFRKSVWNY